MQTMFRQYPDGEIIAILPEEPISHDQPNLRVAYVQGGGVVSVDMEVVIENTKPASKLKYARMLRDMRRAEEFEVVDHKAAAKMAGSVESHEDKVEKNRRRFRL